MFGPHLTLDLYECNKKKISDKKFIHSILDELPQFIGMHKISAPNVFDFQGNPLGNPTAFDQGGISAFVLIAESHISIHTFVNQGYVSVDIFSCKMFEAKKAEEYLIKKFEAKGVEKHLIMRGKEFPKDVEKAARVVIKSRGSI